MGKKDGMYCYYDWIKPLERIPAEDFKAFFLAMMKFSRDDEEPPEFEGITGMAQDFIFPQIARSKIYAANGQKGGRATQSKAVASTNGSAVASTLTHNTNTETKTDTKTNTPFGGEEGEGFERFWSTYPKKTGKDAARNAYNTLSDINVDELCMLVERWNDSAEWKRENGRFIKQPAKFLTEIFPERINPPDYNENADGFWNEAIEAGKRRNS